MFKGVFQCSVELFYKVGGFTRDIKKGLVRLFVISMGQALKTLHPTIPIMQLNSFFHEVSVYYILSNPTPPVCMQALC